MKRILLLASIFFGLIYLSDAQIINVADEPNWVNKSDLDFTKKRDIEVGEGYRYILVDDQRNLLKKEAYVRYAMQVITPDGIQGNSDIQIDYDPSYQKLEVHEVIIYRNGKAIDKLIPKDFKFLQKETSSDRHIYDGDISALLHLTDVQKNDIIDYSYTLKGFNPVYGDQYSGFLYHKFYTKVELFNYRVLVPEGLPLQIHDKGHTYIPDKSQLNGFDIYEWQHSGLEPISFDTNVPYWSAIYPLTSFSTFRDWKSVVDWALPLYEYSQKEVNLIQDQLPNINDNIERITGIIRYVQDDIRYLGLESGMSGYLPNALLKVFNQKFGDCKDKSLLLVALLRNEGLEAYPMLVNTQWKDNIEAFSANAATFDHCVVTYTWNGEDYFVDPTISGQGGNLTDVYFPDYKKGLVLKPGNSELLTIPTSSNASQKVEEVFTVSDMLGNATLQIKTEYRGRRADEVRSDFMNSTVDEISKTYLTFYSGLYPGIKSISPIEFIDSDRSISNVVTTIERYSIDGFWEKPEKDENGLYAEVYPLEMNSRLNFPQSPSREMDYYVGQPETFILNTKLIMPSYWPVEDYKNRIESPALTYENEITGEGNIIQINHKLEILQSSISGSEVANLLEIKSQISDELTFFLTHNPNTGGSSSIYAILAALILLAAFFYLGYQLYQRYNPDAAGIKKYDGIGGWLVFPAISLVTTPILILYNLLEGNYFLDSTWQNVSSYTTGLLLYFGISFIFLLGLFMFSILTAIFFFSLRTGAPQLFMILISLNAASLIIEAYVLDQYFHELGSFSSSRDIARSVIGLFIWLPYFIKSTRVKSTFTTKYEAKDQKDIPVLIDQYQN